MSWNSLSEVALNAQGTTLCMSAGASTFEPCLSIHVVEVVYVLKTLGPLEHEQKFGKSVGVL